MKKIFSILVFPLFLLLGYAHSEDMAVSFTENEERAIVLKMTEIMLQELNHGNEKMFFMLEPNSIYYIDSVRLYDIFEENSFRGNKILNEFPYKMINGEIESIQKDGSSSLISLKTATPEAPYRLPIQIKMGDYFNDLAFELVKGDHVNIFSLILWKYNPNFNSMIFLGSDPVDFMSKRSKVRFEALKSLLREDSPQLSEMNIKELYLAVKVSISAKLANDFIGLSDEEIISSISIGDYDDYTSFKNNLLNQ